jgi:hypothetical protein
LLNSRGERRDSDRVWIDRRAVAAVGTMTALGTSLTGIFTKVGADL